MQLPDIAESIALLQGKFENGNDNEELEAIYRWTFVRCPDALVLEEMEVKNSWSNRIASFCWEKFLIDSA